MVIKSFRFTIFANFPPNLLPTLQTVGNYVYVWHFSAFPHWYLNSTLIALSVTAASVFIGSLSGYAFARLRFRGRDILFYTVLATLMIPFPVVIIAEYILMVDLGWVNTYQAVIVPSTASAVNVFLMRQYFTTIPQEVEDAAKIDGLRPHQIFFRVAAPLAKPAYAASAIYTFIGAWNSFLWPLLVLHSVKMFTLPLAINFFKGANGSQIYWNQMTAAEVLTMIPTIVIYVVFEKYFVKGIALSGSKG
jgi:ABC-type sugar transport system, permease component